MDRRTVLAAIGAGAASLAGCTADPGSAGTNDETSAGRSSEGDPSERSRSEDGSASADCPTSQDLGVDWPEDLDRSTVESFVEAYERVYYRERVVEYEPESPLDSYDLAGSVNESPTRVGDGWEVTYSGSGGVYRPTLFLEAATTDPDDGETEFSVDEVDDEALADLLERAAETGDAELHVDSPGEEVERYVDLLVSLSTEFESLSGRGDSEAVRVDVDGTTVELTAQASSLHGDYWWEARYYVTDRVVRRTDDDETDPRDGTLLECRSGEGSSG
ncbi:hypothetical protein Hbl1158_11975 [Halobaculum sp. CBA1158]|uniref:hypothetical protein n=1 Tax=Halobaculum sp. CBA1158 TaxID=2904243 RepID=UPI001F2C9B9A|nr:hypothetical protein [Halobaculum sp. CBA1158]UIO99243.1 hypothetical protein Hbl1158_11975 [Halobaculum sp. CBA1158]